MNWFMYVVNDQFGRLYAGVSTDVHRRVAEHNAGKGSRLLRGRALPCDLLALWCFEHVDVRDQRVAALRAEKWFKALPRKKKVAILEEPHLLPQGDFEWSWAGQEPYLLHNLSRIRAGLRGWEP